MKTIISSFNTINNPNTNSKTDVSLQLIIDSNELNWKIYYNLLSVFHFWITNNEFSLSPISDGMNEWMNQNMIKSDPMLTLCPFPVSAIKLWLISTIIYRLKPKPYFHSSVYWRLRTQLNTSLSHSHKKLLDI